MSSAQLSHNAALKAVRFLAGMCLVLLVPALLVHYSLVVGLPMAGICIKSDQLRVVGICKYF